ncbi:MAG: tetratricopeptide repeat protein [Thermodesulfobacteriota bacterium]
MAVLTLVLSTMPHLSIASQAVIKTIQIEKNPLVVKFSITQDIPVKVIRVEKNELLIALKNIKLSEKFKIKGREKSGIKHIGIETLQGNVLTVILTSFKPFGYIQSGFNKSGSAFIINLEKKEAAPVSKSGPVPLPAVKKNSVIESIKKSEKIEIPKESIEKSAKILEPYVYVPPQKRERAKYRGDISDIVREMDDLECDPKQIHSSIVFLKKSLFAKAFDILDQYIVQEKLTCLEEAYFLKAYAFYENVKKDDFAQLLKAEQLFQEALVSYPGSAYVPYGYGSIGMIQKQLNNISAALGYFNIVKQGYLEYSGLPEIMYHLADIYDSQGYLDKALTHYKHVFEETIENDYIPDAGIGYGKTLFKKRRYLDSLTILNYVMKSNPKKVYDAHELLLYIGNAHFEIGNNKPARINLTRLLNLFPDIKNPDTILSKIGDTYSMDNISEKAIKIYGLVIEKFPDSKGYISSSIGIARYLETDEKKIEIYEMIKNKFPEDKYARIAMMRLAEIYQNNGEHNRCIKEIEGLLLTHPQGLRYGAVKLMQRSYEALFEKELKSDEYTKVLNRYELEHTRIDRMDSRSISLSVGLAYLQAKLYEESFNHLINAYKQYKRSSRPFELLFGLGVAMDESGRDDDALKLFSAFSKQFPNSKHRAEVLSRAGNIYLEKKRYKLASSKFELAYKIAKTHLKKGEVLLLHSNVYEKKSDMKTAAKFREDAIKELALASGENYEILAKAHRQLGQTYTYLKQYIKSADSYLKALSFSQDNKEKANLGFLVGDAYQKGNILPKAKKAFKQVVEAYDSIWARMAQQRLSTLELASMAQNS